MIAATSIGKIVLKVRERISILNLCTALLARTPYSAIRTLCQKRARLETADPARSRATRVTPGLTLRHGYASSSDVPYVARQVAYADHARQISCARDSRSTYRRARTGRMVRAHSGSPIPRRTAFAVTAGARPGGLLDAGRVGAFSAAGAGAGAVLFACRNPSHLPGRP